MMLKKNDHSDCTVGADVEQPSSNKLTQLKYIDLPGKGNLQATNNAENTAKSAIKRIQMIWKQFP